MKATLTFGGEDFQLDLDQPFDLSISLKSNTRSASAWYVDPPVFAAEQASVADGGSTNFNQICFNPHAHMTHTECLGHITKEFYSVNQQVQNFNFPCFLITVEPTERDGDLVIGLSQIKARLEKRTLLKYIKAIVVRTLPNTETKLTKKYDHTNPPYFSVEAMQYIVGLGIEHLLIDLPSVDKEKDGGALSAHKTFWGLTGEGPIRVSSSITEFIFVQDDIKDGFYLLNLQIAPIENDASPSRPILYQLDKTQS